MIQVITATERHFSDFGWLKTYWLFSFADYYDPGNIQFGALRVFNDDVVEPGAGFPTHPHEEMEIITLVQSGEITHEDSMGNRTVMRAGEVQRMSAGTGLTHSEFNLGREPVHFFQVWILPDKGLEPGYAQRSFFDTPRKNLLLPIASGQGIPETVSFHTDATIFLGNLSAGHAVTHECAETRRIFVYATKGEFEVNGRHLRAGDQARIDLEQRLGFTTKTQGDFLLIDVPSCKGFGYDQRTLKGARQ